MYIFLGFAILMYLSHQSLEEKLSSFGRMVGVIAIALILLGSAKIYQSHREKVEADNKYWAERQKVMQEYYDYRRNALKRIRRCNLR